MNGWLDDIEDLDALVRYLRATGRIAEDESPRASVLTGGVSNRTVLVERGNGDDWVIKQALPKLRVAVDWFCDPARIHREAAALRALADLAPAGTITPLIFEDAGQHLFAMAAVPASSENWKTMLLGGRLRADHVRQFAVVLATIHRRAGQHAATLSESFADRSFFEALRLEPYYAYTASQVPRAASFYDALLVATRSRRLTLVHGDYSPKNVLVDRDRLVLLDHEVVHWGDPSFDLGFALTHLLSKAHHLRSQRARFADAARDFWAAYARAVAPVPWITGLEQRAVAHTLGCLLARVAGRSPLEYLDERERAAQRAAVVALVTAPLPQTIGALVDAFLERL